VRRLAPKKPDEVFLLFLQTKRQRDLANHSANSPKAERDEAERCPVGAWEACASCRRCRCRCRLVVGMTVATVVAAAAVLPFS
jgi:hypothetical protein